MRYRLSNRPIALLGESFMPCTASGSRRSGARTLRGIARLVLRNDTSSFLTERERSTIHTSPVSTTMSWPSTWLLKLPCS